MWLGVVVTAAYFAEHIPYKCDLSGVCERVSATIAGLEMSPGWGPRPSMSGALNLIARDRVEACRWSERARRREHQPF